jgi:hypothetical protein
MNDDSRGDLPSASAIERYDACRGAYLFSRGMADIKTPELQAMADAGERIHVWLEDQDLIDLVPEELEIAEWCDEQRHELRLKVFGPEATTHLIREDRMWLYDGRKRIFSGKADDIQIFSTTALLIDFKSGRGDQKESPKNRQLRSLAVILKEDHRGQNLEEINVAIIQPLVSKHPLVTRYTAKDLAKAKEELLELLVDINKPDAPRVAGEHCKFCPAKYDCPESQTFLKRFRSVEVETTVGEKLAALLSDAIAAEAIIKAVKARAKMLLKENPASIPGWTISAGANVRSIEDPFGAYKVLSEAALLTRDQFLTDCISVGIGDLEKAIAKYNNLKPAKAKETVNNICAPFITTKAKDGSLEKIG